MQYIIGIIGFIYAIAGTMINSHARTDTEVLLAGFGIVSGTVIIGIACILHEVQKNRKVNELMLNNLRKIAGTEEQKQTEQLLAEILPK